MTVRRSVSSPLRLAVTLAGGLAALGLLTSCGAGTVDAGTLEEQITNEVTEQTGEAPEGVTCPDDLEGEEGATTTCVLTATDGSEFDVAVDVTSVEGEQVNFNFEVATEPTS
ncbi:hypothetical protein GCM10009737_00610 [Nocardioides lentus]|uniref:DUF4333 domain-containing protein n=1 Tax=Nocardioides lentus TaxID=338077 RepID=A0ABN2NX96_9ACTN